MNEGIKLFLKVAYYTTIFSCFFFLFYNHVYNYQPIVRYENDLYLHLEKEFGNERKNFF